VSSLEAQATPVDLILFNGKIVTVDDAFSIREAIVIKDGRIVALGGNELRNRYSAAHSIDLRGRTVIPGFNDTHIHLGGHSRRYIDFTDTTSLAQLKQQVSDKAKELGPANGSPAELGTSITSRSSESRCGAIWMRRRRTIPWC